MRKTRRPPKQKERKSNSLAACFAALSSSKRCLEMLCENQRLEIKSLLFHLRQCTGDEAESTAHQCDHFGINASKWWKAVKRARKFLKPYSVPPASDSSTTSS